MNLRRKRMILMDGQWYGYLRTASGNPLTLQNAKRLRKLTIYGNAVQDGTPSPDAPVEVQLCGDRTGNLFDISQVGDTNTLYNDGEKLKVTEYSNSTNISVEKFLAMTGLRPGDVFTVARQYEVINGTANSATGSIRFNKKDGSGQFSIIPGNKDVASNVVPDDFNNDIYNAINFYGTDSGDLKEVIFSNIQILKGSYTADTLPAYEPYGYKVSGRAEGINLLDYTKATDRFGNPLTIIDDGVIWDKMIDYYFYIPCDLKSGITVSFSCKSDYPENSDIINSFMVHYVDGSTEYQPIGFSITLKNDVDRIQIRKRSASTVSETPIKVTDIMLVQGSYTAETMPPYEPYQPPQGFAVYLPEQIAKVGDVADEVVVDFEKQTAEIRKNIIQDTFTGDDGWYATAGATDTQRYFAPVDSSLKVNNGINVLCTHSVRGISAPNFGLNTCWLQSFSNGTAWFGICVDTATYPDVNSFEAFVSQQYNSGHALSIYHAIEPVTTGITSLQQWDAMPQVSGTVTLTLSAEVEPSGAEAVYYSKERGE